MLLLKGFVICITMEDRAGRAAWNHVLAREATSTLDIAVHNLRPAEVHWSTTAPQTASQSPCHWVVAHLLSREECSTIVLHRNTAPSPAIIPTFPLAFMLHLMPPNRETSLGYQQPGRNVFPDT